MPPYPSVTVIISVYKKTVDLAVVLKSLEEQSYQEFEVVISEDGESEEMASFLNHYNGQLTLAHLTQIDKGWQKNKALNQAIRFSKTEYLIFIDGDCVLHPKFVEEHLKHADQHSVLAGRRVKLGPKTSAALRKYKNSSYLANGYLFHSLRLFADRGSFIDEGIYSAALAKQRRSKTLKGCNFSCFKSAMVAINGFDENFSRPAVGEDTDLDWRFEGMGYSIESVRHLAVQYHLHHPESWTDTSQNMAYMKEKQNRNEYVAVNGLSTT